MINCFYHSEDLWRGIVLNNLILPRIADAGYYFSIPPVVERAQSFQALARKLPLELILTETDAPYMGPDRGERNEPANVPRGVAAMAEARGIPEAEMAAAVRENFRRLFGC